MVLYIHTVTDDGGQTPGALRCYECSGRGADSDCSTLNNIELVSCEPDVKICMLSKKGKSSEGKPGLSSDSSYS